MNSMIKERLELAKERITEIKNESNVGSFSGFFEKSTNFLPKHSASIGNSGSL